MKTKLKYIALCFLLVAFTAIFSACSSSDKNPYQSSSVDKSMVMTNADITVDASAGDRSMRITEKLEFEFSGYSKHGFYRDIALNSGEKVRNVKVSDYSDFGEYEIEHEDSDFLRIILGDADKTLSPGKHSCTISYTLITPPHADYPDSVALNVLGQGWSCVIKGGKVKVILPAETETEPQYYYGKWGENINAVTSGKIKGDTSKGKSEYTFTFGELDAYQGITVYYFLPKGVLTEHTENTALIVGIIGAVLLAICLVLKFLIVKDRLLTPITNFYPPKHKNATAHELPMDPVDMGYLIDNTCQSTDVTSLIFYFASKGYLEISEDNSFTKICDIPSDCPSYQKTLFNKIFESGDTVTLDSLKNKTYPAVQSVKTSIKNKYKGKLYDKKIDAVSYAISAFVAVFAFITVLLCGFKVGKLFYPLGILAVIPAALCQVIGKIQVYNRKKIKTVASIGLIAGVAVLAALGGLLVALLTYADLLDNAGRIMLGISVGGVSFVAPFISRRTSYYSQELDEVLGFKDFLKTAEKERLEALLEENPQYYYDILPYANVLGVSDIWQNKFASLAVEPPSYYRSSTAFDILMFNSLYRSSYTSISTAMISSPSSSSHSGGGHFSGGGGFSGGGFGGGGGGSW